MSGVRPASVLFACDRNTIRSPIAAALARRAVAQGVYVASAGIEPGEPDPFAAEVMAEIGVDLSGHRPMSFEELADENFDLVVTLSPPAHHRAMELTRTAAVEVEYWPTPDPTAEFGARDRVLDAYRGLRDHLARRVRERFG